MSPPTVGSAILASPSDRVRSRFAGFSKLLNHDPRAGSFRDVDSAPRPIPQCAPTAARPLNNSEVTLDATNRSARRRPHAGLSRDRPGLLRAGTAIPRRPARFTGGGPPPPPGPNYGPPPAQPIGGLGKADLARWQVGKTAFLEPADVPGGLGPVFNENACAPMPRRPRRLRPPAGHPVRPVRERRLRPDGGVRRPDHPEPGDRPLQQGQLRGRGGLTTRRPSSPSGGPSRSTGSGWSRPSPTPPCKRSRTIST